MASGFGRFGRTDGFGIFGMNSRVMSEGELVDARFRLMMVCRGSASRIQFRIFFHKGQSASYILNRREEVACEQALGPGGR